MGAVAVPVNTASVGEALHHTLDHSESVGVIADADLLTAVDAAGDLPQLRWRVGVPGESTPVPDSAVPFARPGGRGQRDARLPCAATGSTR